MWKFRRRSVSILLPQATNLSWIQWPSCTQCKIQLCPTSYDLKKSTTTTTTQMDGLWRQLPPFKWCFVVFQPNPTCFNACWSTSRICKRSCRKEQKPVSFVHFFLYDCLGTEKRCQENCPSWQKFRTSSWGSSSKKKETVPKKCQEKTRFEPGDQEMPKPVNAAVLEKIFKKNTTFGVNFKACAANAVSDAKAVSLRAFYSFHNRRNTRSFESSQDGQKSKLRHKPIQLVGLWPNRLKLPVELPVKQNGCSTYNE